MPAATAADHAEIARRALEEVCSNRDPEGVPRDYHPDFVDHVNRLTYRGHEGVRRSVALYVRLFPDLRFTVDDQVSEGDKVASRWTLRGTHRGREVELRGIVISRFEDGRIIEDWAVNDTMELLRQLGPRRGLTLALRQRKRILDPDGPASAPGPTRRAIYRIAGRFRRNDSCPMPPGETERIRRIFDKQAPKYDKSMFRFERRLFAGNREWVCERAGGEILDLAAGTARNLPFYPADARVTGIELSPKMAELGRRRAEELGREIDLRVGDAEALPFPDERFDTVVCTYGLCTIPDDAAAVREAKRVLRPGGRLVLAEHVRSPNPIVRAIQRILQPLAHPLAGDNLLREPLDHLTAEGFEIDEVRRLKAGLVELVAARKPESEQVPPG
ncbi:MAG TPA: ester cyclase [Streptosporangiaceae bacterium]|nr:ester cyclase [Streptosporangiaceae bacterium]